MTIELYYLLLTAVLTGILWVPVVIGMVMSRGTLRPIDYKVAPTSPLPDWVNRANRAHLNAVETFATFAAVVLIGKAVGVSTVVTQVAVMVYFYARVAHALLQISGFSHFMARTVVFTISWIAFLVLAVEVCMKAS
jgi:uncharacterized MAPEG superfamily protein